MKIIGAVRLPQNQSKIRGKAMSGYEWLLLGSNVGLLALSILWRRSNTPLLAMSGISLLLLLVHLFVDGWRIQLLFPYVYTLVILALSIYRSLRRRPLRVLHKGWAAGGYSLIALLLAVSGALLYLFPLFKLPEPTGAFALGTQTFHLIDDSREERFAETPGGKRQLMIQLWYPAQQTSGRPYPFMPDADRLLAVEPISSKLGLSKIFMSYLKRVPTHAYENAEAARASETYPVVLLNHGFGMSRLHHTSQAEHLASHGYIVAAIDHPYSTFGTVFPDGTMTTLRTYQEQFSDTAYRDSVGKVWTDDIVFTLDQLERIHSGDIPSRLRGKLDLSRIGIFGHSFGGAASYDATYDPRIIAGMNLDGSLYRYDQPGSSKPFMFMMTEQSFDLYSRARQGAVYSDRELEEMGIVDRESFEEAFREVQAEVRHLVHTARQGGQIVYIDHTGHYNFTDLQLLTPLFRYIGLTGEIDPSRAVSIINAYTLDFFDKYLKHEGGRLVEGAVSDYPEVKFVTGQFAEDSRKSGSW